MSTESLVSKIIISLEYVDADVNRVLEVPVDITLDELHDIILGIMDWDGDHLSGFEHSTISARRRDREQPGPDLFDSEREFEVTLADVVPYLKKDRSFMFTYDYGDSWLHRIKVYAPRKRKPGVSYPRLVSATGRAPIEDMGGWWGYMRYVEIMTNPEHPEHEDMTQGQEGPFDPNYLDVEELAKLVAKFA